MSEQPVSAAKAPPKGKPAGKKVLGLPLPVALGLGAGVLALGYLWLRSRKKASAGGSPSASVTTTTSAAYASQLDQMQAELDSLLQEQAGGGGTGGGIGGGGSGGTIGTTTQTGGGTSTKTSTSTKTTTKGTGTTKTTTKTTSKTSTKTTTKAPRAPAGLSSSARFDSATVKWNAVPGATSYRVRAWHDTGGKADIVHDSAGTATSVVLNGLKQKTAYGWHVAAVGPGGEGPWSATAHFTTK